MDDEEIKTQLETDPSNDKPTTKDKSQISTTIKTSKKSVVKISSSDKTKLSVKSTKSKLLSKSGSVVNSHSQSNKVLLTKSLDSVKAMLASKETSTGNLKATTDSVKKINRATSIGAFLKNRKHKARKSKRYKKIKESFLKLDAATIRKIARELIRKRGQSLLNVHPFKRTKKRSHKKMMCD